MKSILDFFSSVKLTLVLLLGLFGERIAVEETLRVQRGRPKLDYLLNPEAAEPFAADTISGGFAPG